MSAPAERGELGLSILGLGTQYPPHALQPNVLDILAKRYYPDSPAMKKVLTINRYTGIDQRSSIGTPDHPLVNQENAPSITELNAIFMSDGVPLAVSAARKAMAEAHVDAAQITHVVSTTCTNSANPGFDHFVAKELGLQPNVEKVLLHGIGCSGGLAALRTAANLCLGHAMRGKPARILVVALEISTPLVRSELDSINGLQEIRIGIALFSDCASALVLSNSIADSNDNMRPAPVPAYELLGWEHCVIPDTEADLGFDVDPAGWKVVLTPRVPKLTQAVIEPTYNALLSSLPSQSLLSPAGSEPYRTPANFDWAMHPGGSTILTGAEKAMNITPQHMRASYDTYVNHGNSSSATIFSVLNRLRQKDMDELAPDGRGPRELVVGCAFGPGITVEMCLLRRRKGMNSTLPSGLQTPPETESEGGAASEDGDGDSEVTGEVEDEAQSRQRKTRPQETGLPTTREDGKAEKGEMFINEALASVELD